MGVFVDGDQLYVKIIKSTFRKIGEKYFFNFDSTFFKG